MCCSRTSNINKTHERALRSTINDSSSDFDIRLQNSNDTCNHNRNIQTLMVEIYTIYNLRNFQEFATKRKRTVKMDLETLNYRSPQLCKLYLPNIGFL